MINVALYTLTFMYLCIYLSMKGVDRPYHCYYAPSIIEFSQATASYNRTINQQYEY